MERNAIFNAMTNIDPTQPGPESDHAAPEAAGSFNADARLQELEARHAEVSDAYLRAKAEAENTRRRALAAGAIQ